jgi:HEAT repeat protein
LRLVIAAGPEESQDLLFDVLRNADDVRESMAGDAITTIGEPALPGLVDMLDDRDTTVRWRATRCLARMAQDGKQFTLPPLIEAFHDDSPDVARVAADGLAGLGSRASIPVLRSVLRTPLTEATVQALHTFSLHATPAAVFQPVAKASTGSAVSSSTLLAVDKALTTLETQA